MSSAIDRSKVFFYLRLTVGIVLLIILIKIIDFDRVGLILVSAKPHFILLGLVTILINFLLKTYRWAIILWVQEPDISFGRLIRFNFVSMFSINFFPGSISSDIVRIYQVSKYTSKVRSAISSIIVDRVVGNVSTALTMVIAFVALQQTDLVRMGSVLSYGVFGFLLLSIGPPLALQNANLSAGMRRLLNRFSGTRLLRKVRDMYEDCALYQTQYRLLLQALALSFISIIIAVFEFYVVAIAFSAQTHIGYYLIFVPLAIFLAMLPISFGGIGVLEAAMVFFFAKVGMPGELCLSIVMVRRVLLLLSTIPGGILYMIEGFPASKPSL